MDSPIPNPRLFVGEVKKPVPTPRRSRKINDSSNTTLEDPKEDHFNTFSRKVSSISNVSKQIAGDIGQLVQDRKKAVIEGTRQSVRKITRRFSSSSQEPQNSEDTTERKDDEPIDIFKSITFGSPISQTENIYNNVNNDNSVSSDEDSISLPPPSHPPPPLPDESIYDAPASVISSSNSAGSNNFHKPGHYERIFPTYSSKSDSESLSDIGTTPDKSESTTVGISRSSSWKLYDSIAKDNLNEETVYNIVDKHSKGSTKNNVAECDHNSNISGQSSASKTNSVYENHEITSQPPVTPRASKSVLFQFDPLSSIGSATGKKHMFNFLKLYLLSNYNKSTPKRNLLNNMAVFL